MARKLSFLISSFTRLDSTILILHVQRTTQPRQSTSRNQFPQTISDIHPTEEEKHRPSPPSNPLSAVCQVHESFRLQHCARYRITSHYRGLRPASRCTTITQHPHHGIDFCDQSTKSTLPIQKPKEKRSIYQNFKSSINVSRFFHSIYNISNLQISLSVSRLQKQNQIQNSKFNNLFFSFLFK